MLASLEEQPGDAQRIARYIEQRSHGHAANHCRQVTPRTLGRRQRERDLAFVEVVPHIGQIDNACKLPTATDGRCSSPRHRRNDIHRP